MHACAVHLHHPAAPIVHPAAGPTVLVARLGPGGCSMSGDALTSLFSGLGLSNQQQAQHAFSAGQALAGSISYPAGPQQQQASPGAGFNFSPANSPNPFEPLPAAFPSPTGLPGVLSPAAHDNHPFSPQSASPASVVASPTAFGTSLGSSGAGSPGPRQRPTFMFGRPLAQREAQEQQPQPSAHHQLLELEAPFPVHPQHPQHQQSLRSDSIHTSALTLISHEHGRQRRAERGISRRQLQVGLWVPFDSACCGGRAPAPLFQVSRSA